MLYAYKQTNMVHDRILNKQNYILNTHLFNNVTPTQMFKIICNISAFALQRCSFFCDITSHTSRFDMDILLQMIEVLLNLRIIIIIIIRLQSRLLPSSIHFDLGEDWLYGVGQMLFPHVLVSVVCGTSRKNVTART